MGLSLIWEVISFQPQSFLLCFYIYFWKSIKSATSDWEKNVKSSHVANVHKYRFILS